MTGALDEKKKEMQMDSSGAGSTAEGVDIIVCTGGERRMIQCTVCV
jgi:hypothetical protein